MLTRKLLYNGTSKLNFATFPAIQRLAMHSRQILGQQSRLDSRIQHEIRRAQSTDSHLLEAVGEDLLEEEKEEVTKLTSRFLHTGSMAHQVLVLLPYVKSGAEKKLETNSTLMLAEAEALVRTLEWKVVDSVAIGLSSFKKKYLFGTGNLERLRGIVLGNERITAVFISLYQLTAVQRLQLEATFEVPVIDRYNLVLQIFLQHAATREARLQVSLAEIPYLRNRLAVQYEVERNSKSSGGNLGEQYFEKHRFVLKKLEKAVKKKIADLKSQRERLRERRKKLGVPTVAVIGYTNCGKTSLIKALTQQAELEPKNALFATLDVTCHRTTLPPSNIDVVFIDTVGFISDIPTPLVASFSSTLEDALQADLLLHVRDLSHPDTLNQNTQVLTTLKRLGASKEALDSMVTVGNKVDLVSEEQLLSSPCLPVSATLGLGLDHLARQELTPKIFSACDLKELTARVRPASHDWNWLRSEGVVSKVEVCPRDSGYCLMSVVLSQGNLERFKTRLQRGDNS